MKKSEVLDRKRFICFMSAAASICISACAITRSGKSTGALLIESQGSFTVGGTKFTEPGNFDLTNALKPQGQTFHGDHSYAFYQIPVNARKYPLVSSLAWRWPIQKNPGNYS